MCILEHCQGSNIITWLISTAKRIHRRSSFSKYSAQCVSFEPGVETRKLNSRWNLAKQITESGEKELNLWMSGIVEDILNSNITFFA